MKLAFYLKLQDFVVRVLEVLEDLIREEKEWKDFENNRRV